MNDKNPIDFSPLDPSRDNVRWQQLINHVVDRGMAAVERPASVIGQIVAWLKPALATAALVAIGIWLGALSSMGSSDETSADVGDNQVVFVQWALGKQSGSVWEVVTRIGGESGGNESKPKAP